MTFLLDLLAAIVPFLVSEALKVVGKGAPDSVANQPAVDGIMAIVKPAVRSMLDVAEKSFPAWVKPDLDAFEPVLDAFILKEVEKVV